MVRQDASTRSVWNDLWGEHPILYTALTSTSLINNTLLTLLFIATLSTLYDTLLLRLSRQTHHQQHTYHMLNTINSTSQPQGFLATLARANRTSRTTTIVAKAAFHSVLFLCIQYISTLLVVRVARVLAEMTISNRNIARRCARLRDRGLECGDVRRFYTPLDIAAALILLCFIRGLELHIERTDRGVEQGNYSPGFLRLREKCRSVVQSVLAVPIAVVSVYTQVCRERKKGSSVKVLLVQFFVSLAVFLVGNFVCLVAALPDIHGTMQALDESGITGTNGM